MLTERQIEAARRALQEKEAGDLIKRIMLRLYRFDQKAAEVLGLPFRMVHRSEYPTDEVWPNLFYPNVCGTYVDAKTGEWQPVPSSEKLDEQGRRYYFTRLLSVTDFSDYKNTDWTGEQIPQEDADRIRREYEARVQDYREHPERYNTRAWYAGDIDGRQYPSFTESEV